jgi:hypothetical protein
MRTIWPCSSQEYYNRSGAGCGPQDDNVILRCAEGLVCDLPLPIQHKLEFVPGFTLSEQERRELRRCYQYRQNVNDSCDDKYVVCVNGLQCLPLTFNEGICIPPQS